MNDFSRETISRSRRIHPRPEDKLVALVVVDNDAKFLVASENGLGKRTAFEEHPRIASRITAAQLLDLFASTVVGICSGSLLPSQIPPTS